MDTFEDATMPEDKKVGEGHDGVTPRQTKQGGIFLVPRPSSDPNDPLNWSPRKKYTLLFTLCSAAFAGTLAPTAHQLSYVVIARETYNKPPIELSYSISSAVAGLLVGPVILTPFVGMIGRSSMIFWSLLAVIACQIWAALMTEKDDYIAFVISRLIAGLFGAMPTILGPSFIIETTFLHQRGKAFLTYELSVLFGVTAGPTIGGIIVDAHPWPVTFWWTVAPLATAALLVFIFLEETGSYRERKGSKNPELPSNFIPNRIATFLPGNHTVPPMSGSHLWKRFVLPFIIGVSPIAVVAGFYAFLTFGFTIALNALLAIYLQNPVTIGGYGFSPLQNALFTFTTWMSLVIAETFGVFASDGVPLWASRRLTKGIWYPEYRLWNLMLPGLLSPIGLGIFGASLQYHCHYMLLAFGVFLVGFSAVLSVPIVVNYVVECFVDSATEVAVIMNVYRLALGLALPFFIEAWSDAVGNGWLFGMAAFFSLFAAILVALLAWRGKTLRHFMINGVISTEEGEKTHA